jgi:hypothetical protein
VGVIRELFKSVGEVAMATLFWVALAALVAALFGVFT